MPYVARVVLVVLCRGWVNTRENNTFWVGKYRELFQFSRVYTLINFPGIFSILMWENSGNLFFFPIGKFPSHITVHNSFPDPTWFKSIVHITYILISEDLESLWCESENKIDLFRVNFKQVFNFQHGTSKKYHSFNQYIFLKW